MIEEGHLGLVAIAACALLIQRPASAKCIDDWLSVDEIKDGEQIALRATNLQDFPITYSVRVRSDAAGKGRQRVRGTLDVDGERMEIDGYGLRDHSWGPRYWQAIEGYEWLTMNFGDDLGAMVSIIRRGGGEPPRIGGVVIRGTEADFIDDVRRPIALRYRRHGLAPPLVDPRITYQVVDKNTVNLILRIPVPTRLERTVEQRVLRAVLGVPQGRDTLTPPPPS